MEAYYQLGWLYYDLKKWKESERYLSKFTGHDRINEEHGAEAELMLARAKLYAHPVPFDPQPVKDQAHPTPSTCRTYHPTRTWRFSPGALVERQEHAGAAKRREIHAFGGARSGTL